MSTEHPESTQPTADTQERGVQAHQSGQQHGAGSSSSAALLNAAASAFVPPAAAGPAIAASAAESSPAGPVAAAHGRPAQGGRGGGGGRGRGRGGSLSRELQGAGGHAGPRPRDLQLGSGRGSGGGARGGARQYFGSAPAGSGAGPRQQAGEGVLGSSPGRRGVAANHLLAFQTRRDSERQAAACGRGGGGRGARGGGPPRRPAPKPQPYDRNKFLQANFRFLVSDALDVRRFEADPDLMLEWEDVAQVEMLSAAPVRCPITLEERPFCPQITPCGHVFSFPAIIGHLVAHGGPELRKSAPCPLCYTQIAARELRLVQVHQVAAPAVGQVATFQLLRRPRDSINPEAVAAPGQRCERAGAAPADGTTAAGSPGKDEARPVGAPPAPAEAGGGASACNRFSKFTLVGGAAATALWVAEARRLAAYAAQVTAEGGAEAAYEAPNIYSAIDALAARARAAAERRQRTLLEAADPMVQDSLLSPEEAGQQAAHAVRGATTAALSAAAARRERQAAAAARDRLFPSLAAGPPPSAPHRAHAPAPPPVRPRPAAAPAPAGSVAALQAAFSDDEAEGSPPPGSARRQPRTAAMPISAASGGQPGAGTAPGSGGVSPAASAAAAGSTAELPGSFKSTSGLLGSSPAEAGAGGGASASEFFFYQSSDGQWLFLCPLNLRMLLAHYSAYPACPPTLSARVLEVEDVAQDEASRRRMRVLAHLPLTATFQLCEVDLSGLLPPGALVPFADELAQREKKRAQRAKQEARRLKQERAAAAAAAAAAANTGLTAAELRAMPLPSASLLPASLDREAAEEASAAGEAGGAGDEAASAQPAQPQAGVSYAALARDGFAATGPSLSTQPASPAVPGPAPTAPKGAWAPKPAAPAVPAWGATSGTATHDAGTAAEQLGGLHISSGGGKGGKKKLVLFGGSQRKY